MGRGKGVLRKDSSHDVGMVGRRSYMEHLHPLASHPQKRPLDRYPPRPFKRPRSAISNSTADTQTSSPNFLYAPNRHVDIEKLLSNAAFRNCVVHIYAEYLTSANQAIKNRLLWGTDVYTEDSDLVAVLLHTGHYVPPAVKSTTFDFLSVRIRVDRHVRRESLFFKPSDRNGLRSRAWSDVYDGGRLSILDVSVFKNDKSVEINPYVEPRRVPLPGIVQSATRSVTQAKKPSLIESLVSFDMVNRPCLKYDLKEVSTMSLDKEKLPLTRLKEAVLYVENEQDRYEICSHEEKEEKVRFSKMKREAIVKEIISTAKAKHAISVPLRETDIDVLEELPWGKFYWDSEGVTVGGKHFRLSKMSFRQKTEDNV